MNICSSKDIQTFSFPVDEEISNKYVLEFIRTSISESTQEISKEHYFYYTYLSKSLSYEVIVLELNKKDNIPEPFIFEAFYKAGDKKGVDIFVTSNYFTLFINGEFKLLKNIEAVLEDEIEIYINQRYALDIDNIILIDEKRLEEIKTIYLNSNKRVDKKLFPLAKNDSFKYFGLFSLAALLCLVILLFLKYEDSNKSIKTIQPQKIKEINSVYKDPKIVKNMEELFKYLKIYKIKLLDLKYKDKKIFALLTHSDKEKLFDFLSAYDKKLGIEIMQKHEKKDKKDIYFLKINMKI